MTNAQRISLLDAHGIRTQFIGGKLHAQDEYSLNGTAYFEWQCVDGWSYSQLMGWLGY